MQLKNDLVVLDLETTGVWVDKDRIIEIALVKCRPSGERLIYDQRINPQMAIPKAVTALTGISDQDVANAPLFNNVVHEVLEFIGEADLSGFNVERFDLPLLERECQDAGHNFSWRERKIIDVQKVFHLNQKRDLTAAYDFYCQKELREAHSALADTNATLEILEAQVEMYSKDEPYPESLLQFDYQSNAQFYDSDRRFRWWNGKLYMMFGKYAKSYSLQEVVKKDPRYCEWILSANFSNEVKDLVEKALKGQFPKPQKE